MFSQFSTALALAGRLDNKIALITGAADGIGLGMAKMFCKEGATVIMTDIQEKECTKENSFKQVFSCLSINFIANGTESWLKQIAKCGRHGSGPSTER